MSIRRGYLLVLSGPSGSGKTTVLHEALPILYGVEFSVSYTTRPGRSEERDGVDYHFITEEVFRAKIDKKEFLEWAVVHGNLYGTGQAETEAICGDVYIHLWAERSWRPHYEEHWLHIVFTARDLHCFHQPDEVPPGMDSPQSEDESLGEAQPLPYLLKLVLVFHGMEPVIRCFLYDHHPGGIDL